MRTYLRSVPRTLERKLQVIGDCSVIELLRTPNFKQTSLLIIATQVQVVCIERLMSMTALLSGSEEILTLPSCTSKIKWLGSSPLVHLKNDTLTLTSTSSQSILFTLFSSL